MNLRLVFIVLATFFCYVSSADENDTRRVNIGLRLFRTLLASDQLLHKKINSEQKLNLLIVYHRDHLSADHYRQMLLNAGRAKQKGKIRGFPVQVSIVAADQLEQLKHNDIAGIFIVEKLPELKLQLLIGFAVVKQVIVYSPFEGDVQAGVAAGLDVGVRVRPFINLSAMKDANIRIKDLFLKVSKTYEN